MSPKAVLELSSTDWVGFRHAYGSAEDVPEALDQLYRHPRPDQSQDAWDVLWGSVHHQGDVYDSTYAVVPHLLEIAANSRHVFHWAFLAYPASVEISRHKKLGPENSPPEALCAHYDRALTRIPEIVARAAQFEWDHLFGEAAAAAILSQKRQFRLAEANLELGPEAVEDFFEWYFGEGDS